MTKRSSKKAVASTASETAAPAEVTIITPEQNEAGLQRLAELEETIRQGVKAYFKIGQALAEIKRDKLYKYSNGGTFTSFDEYCAQTFNFSKSYGYRLANFYAVCQQLGEGEDTSITEEQARELHKLRDTPEVLKETWKMLSAEAEGKAPTTAEIKSKVHEAVQAQRAEPVQTEDETEAVQEKKAEEAQPRVPLGYIYSNVLQIQVKKENPLNDIVGVLNQEAPSIAVIQKIIDVIIELREMLEDDDIARLCTKAQGLLTRVLKKAQGRTKK